MLKVTCAIIVRQNKILVTQLNSGSDHHLKWEFPGGKQNQEETIEDCIIREIYEELEIEIGILESMIPVKYDYGFKQIELIPFLCTLKSGRIKLNVHSDFKWVTLEKLSEIDFAEADRKLIQLNENQKILEKYLWKNKYDSR
jgi:8-oxo-dGTP diphosphatase